LDWIVGGELSELVGLNPRFYLTNRLAIHLTKRYSIILTIKMNDRHTHNAHILKCNKNLKK
jgi:hypothetical protein